MLIRLLITNFLSFNEETEFNMLAASDQRSHREHVYQHKQLELLKAAALYGANGAGKSNLVKALSVLRGLVIDGGKQTLADLKPFKLASNPVRPSTIEVEFISGGTAFLYGLTAYKMEVQEEWLYESGLGQTDKLLFHRRLVEGEVRLEFAPAYTNTPEGQFRLKFFQDELLKTDTLLFTELANLKEGFGEVKQAFQWFNRLFVLFPSTRMGAFSVVGQPDPSKHFRQFSNEVITSLHTGVTQLHVKDIDFETFTEQAAPEVKEMVLSRLRNGEPFVSFIPKGQIESGDRLFAVLEEGKPVVRQIITQHEDASGKLIDFTLGEESDGTNRLLDFVPAFYSAIYSDALTIIDEIDQSIHPALLKELVRKFMANSATKGQLIFTTHESNLLDQHIFRRDEIWFVEKDKGATQLYPLSDFDIRLDLDIRKGYLNGRFGAIPFLGNLTDLNWEQYAEA